MESAGHDVTELDAVASSMGRTNIGRSGFTGVPDCTISVTVPCYNAAAYIGDTLRSVAGAYGGPVELIVVDDGSTDGTGEIVARDFPHARLVRTERAGPSAARNLGTSLSSGAFLQYLDADDLLAPGKLDRQLHALSESGADVAYGDWQRLQPRNGSYVPGEIVSQTIERPETDLFTRVWCPPAVYLFRRSLVERLPGWNPDLPVIQDARFALDCALYGGTFVRCEGLMASYRVHTAGSVSTRDPAAFLRDRFRNARDVEAWWETHGGLTPERRDALLTAYGDVARAAFASDPRMFEEVYADLERLHPHYVPDGPRHLALASRTLGYRRAERLALWYRRAGRFLRRTHVEGRAS